jgi:tRNA pseudouridine13 synthase
VSDAAALVPELIPFRRLATASGVSRPGGVLRASPEDFHVEELLGFEPEGVGAHLWLRVEKRELDTQAVARQLARAAGVPLRDVGYSGLKDRRAVACQWFSLPLETGTVPGDETALETWPQVDAAALEGRGLRVLEARQHSRKLRRGTHRANRFRIRVTSLGVADAGALAESIARLRETGTPNYFGEQRFGRADANVVQARRVLIDGARERRRHLRGLLYSAARAMLFNRVLDTRVRQGTWDRLLPGEIVGLAGSRSVFHAPEVDDVLRSRANAFDVHPTCPLPGRGGLRPDGEAGEVERGALEGCGAWEAGLERAGLEHQRRASRVALPGLEWQRGDGWLELTFELPPGSYATSVLREVVAFDSAGGCEAPPQSA